MSWSESGGTKDFKRGVGFGEQSRGKAPMQVLAATEYKLGSRGGGGGGVYIFSL